MRTYYQNPRSKDINKADSTINDKPSSGGMSSPNTDSDSDMSDNNDMLMQPEKKEKKAKKMCDDIKTCED